MKRRKPGVDPFRQVRASLERWREQRRRGERIPDDLWDAAAKLGESEGVSKTSQVLRLDYYDLKSRVEACSSGSAEGSVARESVGVITKTGSG